MAQTQLENEGTHAYAQSEREQEVDEKRQVDSKYQSTDVYVIIQKYILFVQREKNRVSARRETSTDVLLQPPHIPSSTTHKLNNTQTTVVGHVQELEHSADDLEVVREEKRLKSFDQQHLGGDMGLYTPPCVCWVNASVSIDTRCEVTKTRIFHSLPPTDDPA